METTQIRGPILIVVIGLVTSEIIWSWKHEKKVYNLRETFTNIAILAGFQLSKYLFAGYQLWFLDKAAAHTLFEIPRTLIAFLGCFVLADFLYYWFHRASHVWKPLWAFHVVHHSSPLMNLTTAYRLNWFNALVSPLFFIPAAIIGFPPEFIILAYALNLLYQFFLHTEAVGKIPAIEGILDTPSAHRVHHGSNPRYIDKNFGGVFMLWDRLFGTYEPETEKVKYGITTGYVSSNPFKLVCFGFVDLFRKKLRYKG